MNKKIILSVCFITGNHFSQIRADKSFRVNKGRRENRARRKACRSIYQARVFRGVQYTRLQKCLFLLLSNLRVIRSHKDAAGHSCIWFRLNAESDALLQHHGVMQLYHLTLSDANNMMDVSPSNINQMLQEAGAGHLNKQNWTCDTNLSTSTSRTS